MTEHKATPKLDELVTLSELQSTLSHVFRSPTSLAWEVRQRRAEYIAAGALFEVAGRLMAHPEVFKETALQIAARKLAPA